MVRIKYDEKLTVREALDDIIDNYLKQSKYSILINNGNKAAIYDELDRSEQIYLDKVNQNRLHKIPSKDEIFGLNSKVMNYFFSQRYEKFVYIPFLGSHTCPICNSPEANTVDHVLPKEKYVQFTLTPCNLVPICDRCNTRKKNYIGSSPQKNAFHPYFDNIEFKKYLEGKLVIKDGVKVIIGIKKKKSDETSKIAKGKRIRYYNNYFHVYKIYKTFNAMAERSLFSLIQDLNYVGTTVNRKIIKEQITSEYTDLSNKKYHFLNENYIKMLVYKTLYDNLSTTLVEEIQKMATKL